MEISTHGVMRGGIHLVHSWTICKFKERSVMYYNNIRCIKNLKDRLIDPEDTRIIPIKSKLISDSLDISPQLILKSFESKPLDIYTSSTSQHLIVLRNPYNNLASSIAYLQRGGICSDIYTDETFRKLWKQHAYECLDITYHLPHKIVIIYDLFIVDKNYRQRKAKELGLPVEPDELVTLHMGGGSSFDAHSSTNYLTRASKYKNHPMMKELISDSEIEKLWQQILEREQ